MTAKFERQDSDIGSGLIGVVEEDVPLIDKGTGPSFNDDSNIESRDQSASMGKHRMRQSAAYVFLFVSIGLYIGVCGPALPWVTRKLPEGANLATAFALRGVGGLAGSFISAWALHYGVPGHVILAGSGLAGAAGVVSLRASKSVSGVAAGLIALDSSAGLAQAANTMMAWIQPQENLVAWLNILNGTFGIGTLISPMVVAVLATVAGSHDAGVKQALLMMPLAAAAVILALFAVPSPRENTADSNDAAAAGGWRYWTAAIFTAVAINGAVGAETTFGAFLVAYAGRQRELGILDVSDRQADMITSAFWFAFTTGRLGSGALQSVLSKAPFAALWCQIAVMASGLGIILLFPASSAVLCAGAIMMGAGVAGLFAGYFGQLANNGIPIDSKVGGITGIGVMTGIAVWQAAAAAVDPRMAIHMVAGACLTTAAAEAVLQLLLTKGHRTRTKDNEEDLENRVVNAMFADASPGTELEVLQSDLQQPHLHDIPGPIQGKAEISRRRSSLSSSVGLD